LPKVRERSKRGGGTAMVVSEGGVHPQHAGSAGGTAGGAGARVVGGR
jgi:hypothetical protein